MAFEAAEGEAERGVGERSVPGDQRRPGRRPRPPDARGRRRSEGERWLDVATGTGEIAIRAAKGGADVPASTSRPVLLETGALARGRRGRRGRLRPGRRGEPALRRRELRHGLLVVRGHVRPGPRRRRGGAGAGVQAGRTPGARHLAPDRRRRRLLQDHGAVPATRARGRWQPVRVGRPRAPGGDPGRLVRADLRGGRLPADSPSAEAAWELFSTEYGPTQTLANSLDDEKREALKSDWIAYFEQFPAEGGGVSQPRPYVLVLGTRSLTRGQQLQQDVDEQVHVLLGVCQFTIAGRSATLPSYVGRAREDPAVLAAAPRRARALIRSRSSSAAPCGPGAEADDVEVHVGEALELGLGVDPLAEAAREAQVALDHLRGARRGRTRAASPRSRRPRARREFSGVRKPGVRARVVREGR